MREEADQGHQGSVEIPVEKRILASRLGMTPENLSRAFAALRSYGVKVDGARVEIPERDALTGFAKPDPPVDAPENALQVAVN